MGSGCVAEVDMFLAYRRELSAEQSVLILRHLAGCSLCHDLWKRFELDERIAEGIQCALRGDSAGADTGPGWGPDEELPETLEIPGFRIRPGYIEGGQARVYRGIYEASQEEVAIKVFHNSLLNEGGQERFAREIKSVARLRHPNLITIRSDGQIDGHPYFVMPWIEGLTLDEYVKQTPLSFIRKVELISKICEAVSHAHQRGVMHLDLKPTNVRVDVTGQPIVMDFGLARLTETDYSEPPGTPPGVAGTPLYMAPEQIENREDLDVRADVYGLGLLLYEVLVGRRAKGAQLTQSQAPSLEVAREVPPPPRAVNPKVPRELEAVTLRALEVDRERRYLTARALYEDLEHYRQGRVVQAYAHRRGYRLHKWMHLHRERIASLGLIGLVMGLGLAIRTKVVWDAEHMVKEAERRSAVEDQKYQSVNEERGRNLSAELERVRRELADTLEMTGSVALGVGDWGLAGESYAKARRLRAKLDVTPMSRAEAP
ncbi:MAG: serine/threonine-protein kinase [Planctomycetota bacterium]